MKKIYLAGKVTGLPEDQVLNKFQKKTEELTQQGYTVYNPVSQCWSAGLKDRPWIDIMKVCLQMMLNCDEVHLLPCWADSKGACLERDMAQRLGMKIVYH